jgi:hypothetical protein
MSIRTLLFTLSTTVLLSSAAVAQPTTTNTRELAFPVVAFGNSETLEVNVINVAVNSTAAGATPASCTGSIVFRNVAGATIGSATPFTLTSGQISTARLPFATAASTGTRVAVHAVIDLTLPATTPRPPCSLQTALEVFDSATNATHVYIGGGSLTTAGPLPRGN